MIPIRLVMASMLSATFLIATTVSAAQLYRFTDENGIPTLSKTLPPEVAQQGYDILDEKSMRVIERVPPAPTEAEIAEREIQKKMELEQQKQAEEAARIAAEKRRKQAIYDHNLLSAYQSEQDLLNERDEDLQYRENRIEILKAKRKGLQQRLQQVQQQAADNELSGLGLSPNLQSRLKAAQQELDNNQSSLQQLQTEIDALNMQYELDQQRLRELLGKATAD
ncbi:DUF4124 domain-containing protein [Methylophaga pinxianii]|uniref:DUF4124 domain-containing protein n=2 Tax=Methylophaga pinxianii TaxID=2881052 RepID=UPI001CF2DF4E|nr:DUF4124 domain-containing protein [Methylophaga pinxianii]UPH46362.1 DUF4124 domain-containing protein [Methylophaga pinxianii]